MIPRLREQGPWVVLALRPGRRPLRALAQRLVAEDSTRASTLERSSDSGGRFASRASSGSSLVVEPRTLTEAEAELRAQLQESPSSLALSLGRIAEQRGARLLLFVDQLEEIFTLVEDEQERSTFVAALCFAADDPQGPLRVVFTLRDDFLGRLAGVPASREALSRVTVLGSPSPEALEEIVSRPVALAGYRYDQPGLTGEMVAAVLDEPAALPLLQFAGRMLWRRRDRDRRLLRRAVYDEMGGVEGALAHHADGVMERFTPEQARVARELFLRLVTPERTRRVVPEDQLLDGLGEGAQEVLDRLVAERAILAHKARGGGVAELELVHESLIRNWARLERWIDESGEERAFLEEVGQAAELWRRRGRRDEEVWRGDALWDALRRAERLTSVPGPVQHFLAAGRGRAQRRERRRRTLFGAVFAAVVLIAVVLGVQTWLALDQRRLAETQRAAAQLEGARAAVQRGDVLEARAKLRGALETSDTPLARALWLRLASDPLRWRHTLGAAVWDVAIAPDGGTVAVACLDRTVPLIDVETREVRVLRGHRGQVHFVRYAPDGARLLSVADGGETLLWDLASGEAVRLEGHEDRISGAAFSADGQRIVTSSFDGTARLWDGRSGEPQAVLRGHGSYVRPPAISPDGRRVATPCDDHHVRIWDAATGALERDLVGHADRVDAVAFSPDGRGLASASWDGTVRLWDADSGALRHVLEGHLDRVHAVAFVPDGDLLVTAAWDQTLRTWDTATGEPRHVLRGHDGHANEIEIDPTGTRVAAGCSDRTVRVWDLRSGEPDRVYRGHEGGVQGIGFGPAGRWLASGGEDLEVRLWDRTVPARRVPDRGHRAGVYGVAVHPDGALVASASADRTVRLWDLPSGAPTRVLGGHGDGVRAVDFHPGGAQIATGGLDRTVRLWDVATGALRSTIPAPPNLIAVRFSPDGRLLAGHSHDGVTWIWGAEDGRRIAEFAGGGWDLAFHPDGRQVALASWSNSIPIHDATRGVLLRELVGHDNEVVGVRYAADGRALVSGGIDGTVRIWDLATGEGRVLDRLDARVHWLDIGPGGRWVGAPTSDGNAYLWDLADGHRVTLAGHRAEVNGLRFSPDGRWAVTTSDDGTVRTWDVEAGRPHWRTVVVAPEAPRVCSHLGWSESGRAPAGAPPAERWRQAAAERGLGGDIREELLCLRTADGLEAWDRGADERSWARPMEDIVDVRADAGRCLVRRGDGTVEAVTGPQQGELLAERTVAWERADAELLVATADEVRVLDDAGAVQRRLAVPAGVTALARVGEQLALGFEDGAVEIRDPRSGAPPGLDQLEGAPAATVTRLAPGPLDSVVVGWANGEVGVFDVQGGACLLRGRLHGAVTHLSTGRDELLVATDLGDAEVFELAPFHVAYRDLLDEVWAAVPVVWVDGRAVRSPAPAARSCQR